MVKHGDDRTHAPPTIARRRGRADERLKRVGSVLRLLRYVTLVVAAALAFAGIATPARASDLAFASLATAAPDRSNVDRSATPAQDAPTRRQALRMRAIVENPGEESDLDDEEAPPCNIAEAPSFRLNAIPRGPGRVRRPGAASDTSRFVAGTGLPRGPPSL